VALCGCSYGYWITCTETLILIYMLGYTVFVPEDYNVRNLKHSTK